MALWMSPSTSGKCGPSHLILRGAEVQPRNEHSWTNPVVPSDCNAERTTGQFLDRAGRVSEESSVFDPGFDQSTITIDGVNAENPDCHVFGAGNVRNGFSPRSGSFVLLIVPMYLRPFERGGIGSDELLVVFDLWR
jgi:hypothetical protein